MKSLIRFFAERHLLANIITFIVIVLGVFSLMRMKRDMFPSVDMDRLIITTRYPGASPEDVELNVTNKLEDELQSVDGIETMTSYSMENISVITIALDQDVSDTDDTKRDIRDAVGRVSDFPEEVTDAPYILEVKSENFEILWVGVAGDVPYHELRNYAKLFEKKLKMIEGVSRVAKVGYLEREIQIEVSQSAMDRYQIPLRDIVSAIQLRNIRSTGGSFESYTSDKSIVALAEFEEPGEVGEVIIRSSFEGPRIVVSDLAVIHDDFEPEKTRFRMNGREVIAFKVLKNKNADVIRVVDAVKEFMASEEELLPPGIELTCSSDMSRFVKNRLGVLTINSLIGLCLVLIVLFVFLNFRTAFWVAMGIPLTLLGVFFVSPFFDVHIDLITMMGLILVIGLIVDDAIVVAENIAHRREMGDTKAEAAVNGTYGVIRPVFSTIITTIMAFGSMFFMTGTMGKFIYSIPLIIILALVISFLEVVLILPAHITAGKEHIKDGKARFNRHRWFDVLRDNYQHLMAHVLTLRYLVIALFIITLAGTFWFASNHMRFMMFPANTADLFYMTMELPTGSSLDASTDKVREVESLLEQLPTGELESYWTIIGSLGGGEWFTPGESENWVFMSVTLTPFAERSRNAEQIVGELRAAAAELSGIEAINFMVDSGGPPVGRPIALRIVGSDDLQRSALADSIVIYLGQLDGVSDIVRDDKLGKEQVEILIDHNRLSELGLTVADIAQNVRLAYDGMVVTRVRYGDEDVGFRVLLEEKTRSQQDHLGQLRIPNRQGRLIPLESVARFRTGPGPSSYFHYDGERSVTISADLLKESSLTPLEATTAVFDHFDLNRDWPGLRFAISGEAQEQEKSMVDLGVALALAAIGIYLVLVLLFGSLLQPLLVMFAIPFGLIGIIGAFAMHNEPLGFLAMMGVIGMMGVVVNDSLILVNFINQHRKDFPEKKFKRIVAEGTAGRLRPILLTSITTVAGLLPTAYGLGGSDPFVATMALAMGWGILFATPLTLLLLPCLYMVQYDLGKLIRKFPGCKSFYFFHCETKQLEAATE